MDRRVLAGAVVGVFAWVCVAAAQEPPAPPKPGPEHKRIAFFAGKWTFDADMKPSPFGPGGKVTGNESCEWFEGGFHLTCRSKTQGAMGDQTGVGIWAYDPAEKVYTYYAYGSDGNAFLSKGKVEGDTWTWKNDMKMGDKTMKSRFTIKEVSPDVYTFTWETSPDGTSWTAVQEGKGTRVK
jgi:hypothetical protein